MEKKKKREHNSNPDKPSWASSWLAAITSADLRAAAVPLALLSVILLTQTRARRWAQLLLTPTDLVHGGWRVRASPACSHHTHTGGTAGLNLARQPRNWLWHRCSQRSRGTAWLFGEEGIKKKVQAHECARGNFRDGEPGLESNHLKLKDLVHIL